MLRGPRCVVMKPQKKAPVARKAAKMPTLAKTRRAFLQKPVSEIRKEKRAKDSKKKAENKRKKLKGIEEKKKTEEKKEKPEEHKKDKLEEHKKEKLECRKEKADKGEKEKEKEKVDKEKEERKKDRKEKVEEKRVERVDEREEEDKKKKVEDKSKLERMECKKKEKEKDERKKGGKIEEEDAKESVPSEEKIEEKEKDGAKKKGKDDKKRDTKETKETKDSNKDVTKAAPKDKKVERKKEKDPVSKNSPVRVRKDSKDSKAKSKKTIAKKTVLAKKSHLSVVKKLVDEKLKAIAKLQEDEEISEEDEASKKNKKKSATTAKPKTEKKPRVKASKPKVPQKNGKTSPVLKKEEKSKEKVVEKVVKKKVEGKESKETEVTSCEQKKVQKDESGVEMENKVKSEIEDDTESEKGLKEESVQVKSQESKKSKSKVKKAVSKKAAKVKVQNENSNQAFLSEETSEENKNVPRISEETTKESICQKQERVENSLENSIELDLKVEAVNGDSSLAGASPSSGAPSESGEDSDDEVKKCRERNRESRRAEKKERSDSPLEERARRMRLIGFWNGPKRHRVASLNALAKVHCLYENETGGVYLGGFCKPKPEKEKRRKEEKEEQPKKEKERKEKEENAPKRKLRNVPGLRGKHWDMLESSSSSSSSDEEACEREKNEAKKKVTKRRRRNEEVMDLKDMVVCKRMASLNATAILAASYSDEKNRRGSSSDSSSESEVEIIKRRKQTESDAEKRKSRQNSDPDDVLKPSNKLVILNQDTDVTITGVYVNQTRSTHHEGYCSIAGMQYRISSTSHTQTAATAVATELHDQQKSEQPCKSYTPLGALSSMQPPGTQGNHPNMSPRRHSAFSAPHQHGYYQPAGPLIQHPPTLPPVKGPPPEPTPTPPQNSEGSDDLVATSTTSGGTTSTGGFYRAYCPPYYGTPPQYADLCYPPTYSHPHAHPPHYYKYAPYRRQYYGYQEGTGGGGPGAGGTGAGPGVIDYQSPPPPPGEYPPPPYYGAYPPPPPPPLPPPNPAYLHSQGRPFVDPFQGCPCPMQSCPKNVDTGPLIGNGKGAPVVSGPGLSLPPSALVGPPSPARGLAGLAPPHGANAWDTDRVQLNNPANHRNHPSHHQNQPPSAPHPPAPPPPPPAQPHNILQGHNRPQNADCRPNDEKNCPDEKLRKCGCQKHACTSTCEVKMETLSPAEKLSAVPSCPSKYHNFKLENNNMKCESCSVEIGDNLPCVPDCNVKCESDYKCDIMKCEQCMKEGQMAILEIDKDSGILLDEKLDGDPDVKEELNDVAVIDNETWKKPDYEPTVPESVEEKEEESEELEPAKCQKVTKRKLSLDSLSDSRKKRKVSKRTLSVGSSQEFNSNDYSLKLSLLPLDKNGRSDRNDKNDRNERNDRNEKNDRSDSVSDSIQVSVAKKKGKKENQGQKRKAESSLESTTKKPKNSKIPYNVSNCLKQTATENSIMETINSVVQQSTHLVQKKEKKTKTACEKPVEKDKSKKKKKKKTSNLISTIKKVAKKVDLAKEIATDKLSKILSRSNHSKSKNEKSKKQDKSKSKCKAKSDSKVHETNHKSKIQEKTKENPKKQENEKKIAPIKKKRKSTNNKKSKKSTSTKLEECSVKVAGESLTLTRKTFLKPKWSNGWSWEGDPFEAKVYLTNEESAIRRCYASMKHESGDVLRPRDCVLLKSGPRKADLPFVAKIAALWENPDDGEMMFSLLWYYRPEHTEQGRTQYDTEDEVFASRHRDANSVACIEDKCYILTFNEYCRYRKNLRRIEEGLESPGLIVPPGDQMYPRENRQPPIPVPADMVLFCRRVYDYRGKKLVKNPG